MEDLFECSVCMEPFGNNGDKLPRVFPCQHTFCQSCIKLIVKKNSVSCPTCRHKHKCSSAETFPRNLTLLQLMETGYHEKKEKPANTQKTKPKPKICTDCKKGQIFCFTCHDAKWCRECMRKNLIEEMDSLHAVIRASQEICSSIVFVEANWKEAHQYMKNIVTDIKDNVGMKPGYTHEVNLMCSALLESHERYFMQDIVSLHDAIGEFHLFRRKARVTMDGIKNHLDNADPLSCSMHVSMIMLHGLVTHHSHRLAEAKAMAHWRSFNTYKTLSNLGYKKLRPRDENEEPAWKKWHGLSNQLSSLLNLILLFSVVWIAADYTNDWFCTERPLSFWTSYFCSFVDELKSRKVVGVIFFIALYCKAATLLLSHSFPPLYVPKITPQELQSFLDRYGANGTISSLEFIFNSNPYFGKWMPPEAREALLQAEREAASEFMWT